MNETITAFFLVGGITVVASVVAAIRGPTHYLYLVTSAGQQQAYKTKDKARIKTLAAALQKAIAHH